MGRKRKSNKVPKVNKELEGLDININELGEVQFNMDIDKLNEFLTREVPDKKLMNRYDDKYQQEFKEQFAHELENEEDEPFVEETHDEEEDELGAVLGKVPDEELPAAKKKKKEGAEEDSIEESE